jgi:tetratricopeptide (TPR) repeat protein
VRTYDGHIVSGANVSIREVQHGATFASTRTDSAGNFSLHNVSPGNYEVTVSVGVDEANDRVQVSNLGQATVDLRLPNNTASATGSGGSSISIAEYRVPAKARALYEKAQQLFIRGKNAEASVKLDAALKIYPTYAGALTLRGLIEQRAGEGGKAIDDFHQAIQNDPHAPLAYLALASTYNSTGRFKEAVPILDEVDRIAPNLWQTFFETARCKLGLNDFEAALRNLSRAEELRGKDKPGMPTFHLLRGYALAGLSRVQDAKREIESYLALEPKGQTADSARAMLTQLSSQKLAAER